MITLLRNNRRAACKAREDVACGLDIRHTQGLTPAYFSLSQCAQRSEFACDGPDHTSTLPFLSIRHTWDFSNNAIPPCAGICIESSPSWVHYILPCAWVLVNRMRVYAPGSWLCSDRGCRFSQARWVYQGGWSIPVHAGLGVGPVVGLDSGTYMGSIDDRHQKKNKKKKVSRLAARGALAAGPARGLWLSRGC